MLIFDICLGLPKLLCRPVAYNRDIGCLVRFSRIPCRFFFFFLHFFFAGQAFAYVLGLGAWPCVPAACSCFVPPRCVPGPGPVDVDVDVGTAILLQGQAKGRT